MAIATVNPLNQFFALNGSPLNNGKLYFGEINKDPEQYPVQMYWDAAGLVPALQPIRTTSGYPSRSGSPAILYCATEYSLRVRQPNDVQVFYLARTGSESLQTFGQWETTTVTPSFASTNSFTLTGDQTADFQPGRRARFEVAAGTVYGAILTSVYGALTTVTMTMDGAQVLDAGLSSVDLGILTPVNPSLSLTASMVGASSLGFSMTNGTLVASVASNALTVAIKTKAGSDPSVADPVLVLFRNTTAATGDYTVLTLTAATSFVVSSGSTMGTTSAVLSKLWIVGFNDAGTFRLGAINPQVGSNTVGIGDDEIASSTAEGGAGGADTGGVFYTGTAVTSKAYKILGYVESTQATAGTWATAPSKIQLFGPGVNLPTTTLTASLGADVALTNTANYFDGPSIAQGTAGTWWVSGSVCVVDSNAGGGNIHFKLWDGTTVIASGYVALGTSAGSGNQNEQVSLSGPISNPAGNLRISVRNSTNTANTSIRFNLSGNSKDSTISAFRLA